MDHTAIDPGPRTKDRALRLWPGVVLVIAQWLFWWVLQAVAPETHPIPSIGGLLVTPLVLIWWLFLSRAPWSHRLGALVLMVVAVAATRQLLHESIRTAINGMLFFFYVIPVLCVALVAGAAAGRRLSPGGQRAALAAAILLGCGLWTLLRTDGITVGHMDLTWRWTATAEQRLLAQGAETPTPLPAVIAPAKTLESTPPDGGRVLRPAEIAPAQDGGRVFRPGNSGGTEVPPSITSAGAAAARVGPAMSEPKVARVEWPGFRGPARDGQVRGVRINTDWAASPPVEMWRRPIGPGWSSFAVSGDLLYTQEQRGDEEVVVCHRVSTGQPVWMHRDATRFWNADAGAGPRGTPTLSRGRVYTFGGTGILNALDAGTGAVVWSRNVAADTHAERPTWGFSSSPLVVGDDVIVAVGGTLAAYDAATGKSRWVGPEHGENYSSPQLMTLDGVAQIVMPSGPGAISVAPADGALLWEHAWEGGAIVQPVLTADGDLIIAAVGGAAGLGLRRLNVKHGPGGPSPNTWTVTERWTSNGLKPYFNDFVVHNGHAFGFDGSILSSIDVADGKRNWKGGRYGSGQLVLLSDQNLLLVLSEEGELALVSATPDKFTEVARFPAIEGKTWNHPVLIGDVLLVRNGEEMAAFRLALARR